MTMLEVAKGAAISLGVTALTVLGMAGTANAAAQDRRDVCFSGACGSGTIIWGGPSNTYADVKLSVEDNKCDGHAAKIRIREDGGGGQNTGPWHVNNSGCHGGYQQWNKLHYTDNAGILEIAVEVCDDGVKCVVSSYMRNPN
jgi:hypothetical protein